MSGLGLGRAWEIGSDLDAAHAGALAGGPGVVVIAGTGSAALARNAAGQTAQAGGWGWLVDDCGGGYWLALRGLAAACEGEDGRGPATALGARAMAFFAVSGLRELLRELHAGRRDRAAVAAFAREVRTAASVGSKSLWAKDWEQRGRSAEVGRTHAPRPSAAAPKCSPGMAYHTFGAPYTSWLMEGRLWSSAWAANTAKARPKYV